jgi:hypothetical protein
LALLHAAKVGVVSSWHWNDAPFGPVNEKLAVVLAAGLAGFAVMVGAAKPDPANAW